MNRKILEILIDPKNKDNIELLGNKFKSKQNTYSLIENIADFYIKDENPDSVTEKQKSFYEDVKFPNYDDIDNFSSLIDKSEKSILPKLLDDQLPYNSKILEVGCGTGQLTNFLKRYGRTLVGTDISIESLKLAEKFREENEIDNVRFIRMNLFKPCFKEESFDVIISNGCLHHTHSTEEAFKSISKLLKKDGLIIVGLYHKYGRMLTNVRQYLIGLFGDSLKFLDKRNIDTSISKGKRYAWFNDQYKNPKEHSHTFFEVLNWFKNENIEFLSSIPFTNFESEISLFNSSKINSKFEIRIKEFFMQFSPSQIREGGFFIMIGKKNDKL
jgi:SAM-dependent methyltransferase